MGDPVKFFRGGVALGVRVVDAIYLGSLDEDIGANFHGAQGSGGISGKVGVARSPAEDDDTALLQVANGAAANIRLGNGAHLNG